MKYKHKDLVNRIQAEEKLIITNQRAMDKVQFTYQCACCHRDANGSFALIVPGPNAKKSPYTGAPLYTCRICKKEIDISNISKDNFEQAYNFIDNTCDVGKMKLDLSNEKDEKLHKKLRKVQEYLPAVKEVYNAITSNRNKKKKNNRPSFVEVAR